MHVTVVIVNWERWEDTVECLETVFRSDYADFDAVVVDNGSTNESLTRIAEWAEGGARTLPFTRLSSDEASWNRATDAQLTLLAAGSNLGFAGGCNLGVRLARSRRPDTAVWLLNNDTVVVSAALRELVDLLAARAEVGIAGSTLLFYDRPQTIQAAGGGKVLASLGRVHLFTRSEEARAFSTNSDRLYIMGASMLIRSRVFDDIGLLDEGYFLGWEETDFCTRAVRRGWTLGYAERSLVYHKSSASIGAGSAMVDYYGTRNGIVFVRRHFPMQLPAAVVAGGLVKILARLARRQPRRIPLLLSAYRDAFSRDRCTGPRGSF